MESRVASCSRVTKETQIEMTLNLDGTGKTDISTGIGFFDHMLSGFARHGLFDLTVKVTGDLEVDSHHTIEDTGIVLGQTIAKALGDKKGIKRYGHFMLPMDEVLVLSAIDLSGRPYLNFGATFTCDKLGELDGGNNHHMAEALFKAFGKALDMAVSEEPRMKEVWSTKGSL